MNVHGKRRKISSEEDIEDFFDANDIEDVRIGMWGGHASVADDDWEPNFAHTAQLATPPPPPPPKFSDLVGKTFSGKFPPYGTLRGRVIAQDAQTGRCTVEFDDDPDDYKYPYKRIKKMIVE